MLPLERRRNLKCLIKQKITMCILKWMVRSIITHMAYLSFPFLFMFMVKRFKNNIKPDQCPLGVRQFVLTWNISFLLNTNNWTTQLKQWLKHASLLLLVLESDFETLVIGAKAAPLAIVDAQQNKPLWQSSLLYWSFLTSRNIINKLNYYHTV